MANPISGGTDGTRTAVATVLTDEYLPGFAVLIHTLKKHNPGFALPFHVFHSPKFAPLSEEGQNLASALHPGLLLTQVDDSNYTALWQSCAGVSPGLKASKPALLFLEAFGLGNYSKVIALHADLLCAGGLDELFDTQAELAATYPVSESSSNELFDVGVMVIGAAHLTGTTHAHLLRHQLSTDFGTGSSVQMVLNDFFRTAEVYRLPLNLNTSKRKFPDCEIESFAAVRAEGTRLLHFEGRKPWEPHYSLPESRFHIIESRWGEELCEALQPIASPLGREILERTIPRLSTEISSRSVSDFRSRIREITKRAESAEEKLRFAVRALGQLAQEPATPIGEGIARPESSELETLREENRCALQRCATLGKESAALERTLRTLEESHLKLKRQLEKMRQRDAHNKAVLKAFEALAAYSIKVAGRLEELSGRMVLWFLKKRLRNWAGVLRRLAVAPEETKKEAKRPTVETESQNKALRREAYLESGEFARLDKLRDLHPGRRCFVLGDGASLEHQDLSLLKSELVIATDLAVKHAAYSRVSAEFYCVSSPDLLGSWKRPQITSDFYRQMQEKARGAMKLLPFAVREHVRQESLYPKESVFYALFEPPIQSIEQANRVEFDLSRHLLDGHSTVLSLAIPLAVHLGCRELILLGFDRPLAGKDSSILRACEIVREKLASRGIVLTDATAGGWLGTTIPSAEYAALFPASAKS